MVCMQPWHIVLQLSKSHEKQEKTEQKTIQVLQQVFCILDMLEHRTNAWLPTLQQQLPGQVDRPPDAQDIEPMTFDDVASASFSSM